MGKKLFLVSKSYLLAALSVDYKSIFSMLFDTEKGHSKTA